jgi:hypothetical protein
MLNVCSLYISCFGLLIKKVMVAEWSKHGSLKPSDESRGWDETFIKNYIKDHI